MNVDALIHSIIELRVAVDMGEDKEIDKKMQQVIKEYNLLKPDSHELEEIYKKADIAGELSKKIFFEIRPMVEKFTTIFVNTISEHIPNLDIDERFKRMNRFARECMKPEVMKGTDFSTLDSILKEGPIDLNAIRINCFFRKSSLLNYIMDEKANESLIVYLFSKGHKLNKQEAEAWGTAKYLVPDRNEGMSRCHPDILEQFLKEGFDINFKFFYDPWTAGKPLLFRAALKEDYLAAQTLVFYGADGKDDESIFRKVDRDYFSTVVANAFRLREEMLEKMQKHLPLEERKQYKDLSISERIQLAKLCQKSARFRDCYESVLKGGSGAEQFGHIEPELKERVALHDKFAQACLGGNFEEAENLLSQDIDINANLILNPMASKYYGGECYPLLNYACYMGDVKLVQFLLKHGADPNIGGGYTLRWFPPLIELSYLPIKNKAEIRDLLLKAGGNPNEKFACNHWLHDATVTWNFIRADLGNMGTMVNDLILSGVDINLPDKIQKQTLSDYVLELLSGYNSDDDFEKRMKLMELLIFYGAKIGESNLKKINGNEKLKPLLKAIRIHDEAQREFLKEGYKARNEYLKGIEALKRLSGDLLNIIDGYYGENELTPLELVEVANRCFKIKG
jgi:hypothetical protein